MQFSSFSRIAFSCSIVLCMSSSIGAAAGGSERVYQEDKNNIPAEAAVNWTFVEMHPTTTPQLFQGGDNRYNLSYEMNLQSFNKAPMTVAEFTVMDADTGKELWKLTGDDVATRMRSTSWPKVNKLGSGESGVIFVNLVFDKQEDAPKKLKHKLVLKGDDMQKRTSTNILEGVPVDVKMTPPLVVGPPFKGGMWISSGGYDAVDGHRRALFPIDNNLMAAQRYAIDWLKVDKSNMCVKGDISKVENYYGYGEPILAIADGTIAGVIDRFENQVPPKAEGDDILMFPSGNTIVLDLGNSRYAMYAHLKPGSIKVKRGDKIKRGDVIANMGNSGNSSAPHLHLHIADGPKILGSQGVPYYFEEFNVLREVPDFSDFDDHDGIAAPLKTTESKVAGKHTNQLVRQGQVVTFPE